MGLEARNPAHRRYWNRIPEKVRQQVVEAALEQTELSPRELACRMTDRERAVARFVEHYNHRRVHESLGNVTPEDMYAGRQQAILCRRERIKQDTLDRRRRENLGRAA